MNMILQDEEIERLILSSCLKSKSNVYELMSVDEDDFSNSDHKFLWKIIKDLAANKIDVNRSILLSELKSRGQQYVDSLGPILLFLDDLNATGIDLGYYRPKLKEMSQKRKIIRLLNELGKEASQDFNAQEIINKAIKGFSNFNILSNRRFYSMPEIARGMFGEEDFNEYLLRKAKEYEDGIDTFKGFRTGFKALDEMCGGLKNGSNIYIGARPGSGKTSFMCNIFLNIAKSYPDQKIGFFSLEMPKEEILTKLLCVHARVLYKNYMDSYYNETQRLRLVESYNYITNMNLEIYDGSGPKISELKAQVRRAIIDKDLKIVFTDYLTCLKADGNFPNNHLRIDQISKGLQDIALEFKIPVVTLCQLNRGFISRADKTPVLSDLRESGSLEEDADLILMLNRPMQNDNTVTMDNTELYCVKNRMLGTLGSIVFEFDNGIYRELPKIELLHPANAISREDAKEEKATWKGYRTKNGG